MNYIFLNFICHRYILKERMPHIANSLNGLINEISVIKSKSEFIMKEMIMIEEKFKTFQNNIQDAISQITIKADEVLILISFTFIVLILTDFCIYYRV